MDTLGLPLSVYVTPADVQDRAGGRPLLAGLGPPVPRLKKIRASFAGAYGGKDLAGWCAEQDGWRIEIVERTFGWLRRDGRLATDHERRAQTGETSIEVAMIRLILGRLDGTA